MRKHDTGEKRMQIAGGHPPPHCNNAAAVREGLGNPGRRPRVRAPQWPTQRPCLRKTDAGNETVPSSKKKMGGKGMRQPRASATRAWRLRPGDLRTSPAEFMARTACAVPFPGSYADRCASSPTQCWLAVLPTFMCARVCVRTHERAVHQTRRALVSACYKLCRDHICEKANATHTAHVKLP